LGEKEKKKKKGRKGAMTLSHHVARAIPADPITEEGEEMETAPARYKKGGKGGGTEKTFIPDRPILGRKTIHGEKKEKARRGACSSLREEGEKEKIRRNLAKDNHRQSGEQREKEGKGKEKNGGP